MEALVHGVSTCNLDDLVGAWGIDGWLSNARSASVPAQLDMAVRRLGGDVWIT